MYAELTVASPSRIKRWSHGSRFDTALRAASPSSEHSICDYGAGDGYLLQLAEQRFLPKEVWAFEPMLADQARTRLGEGARIVEAPGELPDTYFDRVFCMEVLEHLREDLVNDALANIARILKPDGIAIISVPIEIGLSSLLKNVVRLGIGNPHQNTSFGTIAKSFIGETHGISRTESGNYISSHIGFDYRKLAPRFNEHGFEVRSRVFSPIPSLGAFVNSQVTFVMTR